MKPTTNQVFTRLSYNPLVASLSLPELLDDFHQRERVARNIFKVLVNQLTERDIVFLPTLSGPHWFVPVTILPETHTTLTGSAYSRLQVPIEPLTSGDLLTDARIVDDLLLAAWLGAPQHPCTLVQVPGDKNLLTQATEAKLPLDCPLAFELAGVPTPRNYETWRKPDNEQCPTIAHIKAMPHFGASVVHWHNGLEALVTSGDGMQVAQVQIKWLESALPENLNSFVEKNTKEPRAEKQPELSVAEVLNLADKWA